MESTVTITASVETEPRVPRLMGLAIALLVGQDRLVA